ncbi:hypothetical protein ACNKHU_23800 [Shigella flexneri]
MNGQVISGEEEADRSMRVLLTPPARREAPGDGLGGASTELVTGTGAQINCRSACPWAASPGWQTLFCRL